MSYDPSLFTSEIRVETAEEREYRLWAEQLNTTPDAVREAVKAVGHQAEAVREFVAAPCAR